MLIIKNIKELATCGRLGTLKNANIIISKGNIFGITTNPYFTKYCPAGKPVEYIDATGMIALPGFVDCHTHTVFGGSRAAEYDAKLEGLSYSEVQKRGGGIHYTVEQTRQASEDELYKRAEAQLKEMLLYGTTTVEIKSGYGLNKEDELKILRVIARLRKTSAQNIIATFLGAHTVPKEFANDRGAYVDLVTKMIREYLYYAADVDVFCDPLGFTVEESEDILRTATILGYKIHVHGEQTSHFGGAKLAAKYKALSLDHGDYLNDDDIALLAKAGTIVVLLPGVLLHCMEWNKVNYPELVQKLKAAGVPIAFATDYNPGSSPVLSMKVVMDLGMRFFKMSTEECLTASTLTAAKVLCLEHLVGSIEAGKQADLLLVKAHSVEDYLYQIGDRRFDYIIKKGQFIEQ